jgi:hypothetical protein
MDRRFWQVTWQPPRPKLGPESVSQSRIVVAQNIRGAIRPIAQEHGVDAIEAVAEIDVEARTTAVTTDNTYDTYDG